MTVTDRFAFVQAFNRLAVATRLPAAEADATMQQIYWDGLEDLPIDAVTAAAASLERAGLWFPKVAEWRDHAAQRQQQRLAALPAGRDEPWQAECDACDDTGWIPHRCYPGTGKTCGRRLCLDGRYPHDHTFVVPCSCRETNRTYQRHRAVQVGGRRL
jgi:hypothetical protein